MKFLVLVGDGMADYPHEKFNGLSALQFARTPNFDLLAREGTLGLCQTIPEGLPPGSDTANLSVMGYDPLKYYTGRSPFEASSLGINLSPEDVSFRCNLVTLSDDEPYSEKVMTDYCSGEISTEEADQLISLVSKELGTGEIDFHTGFRYRHIMVWHGGPDQWDVTPPHDISGKKIGSYLPSGPEGPAVVKMMQQSYELLAGHPINKSRVERGFNPANSIWIWGNGKKPLLPSFFDKYGLYGKVISAVDLVKGIGLFAGLKPVAVEGATGYIDTNYRGKVEAALKAFDNGTDFVYLHIEAPDECSHRFEAENKIKAIELIDNEVLKVLREALEFKGNDFSILLVTDHATPLALGTHTREPVPFVIFRSNKKDSNPENSFDEESAANTGVHIREGFRLMDYFLNQD
ncbi:MAG: cofactor-independent phosphoglycerate mutase [Bacillota bacterium]|nr:cofactor-independent phosphoglycerate mutase [Bacillota bacterium]